MKLTAAVWLLLAWAISSVSSRLLVPCAASSPANCANWATKAWLSVGASGSWVPSCAISSLRNLVFARLAGAVGLGVGGGGGGVGGGGVERLREEMAGGMLFSPFGGMLAPRSRDAVGCCGAGS